MVEDEFIELAQMGDVDGDAFSPRERSALRFAEAMHQRPSEVPAEALTAVRSEFSDPEFVELGYTVAQFIGMGQFVHLLGVPNPDIVPSD